MLGKLTQIVYVDEEVAQEDTELEPIWSEVGRLRAAVKPVRATESERAGSQRQTQVYLFTVHTAALRAMPVASTTHRFRWSGRAYDVREVRDPEPRVPFTEIVAELDLEFTDTGQVQLGTVDFSDSDNSGLAAAVGL